MTTKTTEPVVPVPLEPLLTMGDLERLLRVDQRTVYRLVERGQFPRPLKVGGQNRWKPEDISDALGRMRGGVVSRAAAAE
jgi:predicted DNA-binding transcriptional regulator AlpA